MGTEWDAPMAVCWLHTARFPLGFLLSTLVPPNQVPVMGVFLGSGPCFMPSLAPQMRWCQGALCAFWDSAEQGK